MLPFRLLLITDEEAAASKGRDVAQTVERALSVPGAERVAVLIREKARSVREVEALAKRLLPRVRDVGARLLVHTHGVVALRLELDGVHLAAGHDARAARAALGADLLLGASRHADDPLDDADLEGLDYALLAPVFRPTSKPQDQRPPLDLVGLKARAKQSRRPVVALGGITPKNAAACFEAGAAAVAVLGGVMGAKDPAERVARYLEACSALP